MDIATRYYHWIWGQNLVREDGPSYLINLEIGVCIRYQDNEDSLHADFDTFFREIADIQFFYGERPDMEEVENILAEAWNYLCYEERILEEDISQINNDDEF